MALYPSIFGQVDLPEPISPRPDRRVVLGVADLRLVRGLEPWTRPGNRPGKA
jgi:hypothetical protein